MVETAYRFAIESNFALRGEAYTFKSLSLFFEDTFHKSIPLNVIGEKLHQINFIESKANKQAIPIEFDNLLINEMYDQYYDFDGIQMEWIFTFDSSASEMK